MPMPAPEMDSRIVRDGNLRPFRSGRCGLALAALLSGAPATFARDDLKVIGAIGGRANDKRLDYTFLLDR